MKKNPTQQGLHLQILSRQEEQQPCSATFSRHKLVVFHGTKAMLTCSLDWIVPPPTLPLPTQPQPTFTHYRYVERFKSSNKTTLRSCDHPAITDQADMMSIDIVLWIATKHVVPPEYWSPKLEKWLLQNRQTNTFALFLNSTQEFMQIYLPLTHDHNRADEKYRGKYSRLPNPDGEKRLKFAEVGSFLTKKILSFHAALSEWISLAEK